MPAKVSLLNPQLCLISEMIADLTKRSRESLQKTIILVPTQRLGVYVLAHLLKHFQAMSPPRIMTLEQLLDQHSPRDEKLVGDSVLDLLLARLVEEGSYTHLRPGHERELRLLHGELFTHGIRKTGLDKLKQALSEDIYKSEQHLGSLFDRASEIESCLDKLDQELSKRGFISRPAHLARAAETLAQRWAQDPIPAEHYVLAAYTSLAPSWQILLDAWLADDRFSFWLSQAPHLYHPSSPLKELNLSMEARVPVDKIEPGLVTVSRTLTAAVAPRYRDEVAWALRGVSQLLAKGFPLESIGILVTDESRYAPYLEGELQSFAFDANLALARAWSSSLAGRCLAAVARLWETDEEMPAVIDCLDQWVIAQYLRGQNPLAIKTDSDLARLRECLLQTGIPSSIARMQGKLKEPMRSLLTSFSKLLEPLHASHRKTLDQWIRCLQDFVSAVNLWDLPEERDILNSCQDGYEKFLETLSLAADHGEPMEGELFWQLLSRHLLESEIRSTGEPLSGLQILILSEARYVPFQAAFLLGCQEGSFPQALPRDQLLDNYLKKAMGLPGWEVLEAMEDQTFHLLKARLPNLLLLRSDQEGEEALVRSRFIEGLVASSDLIEEKLPRVPLDATCAFDATSTVWQEEGRLGDEQERWRQTISASRLESLLRCPYAFLLSSLDVRGTEPPPPWGDSRHEGEWLHAILEALVNGHPDGLVPWDPLQGENFQKMTLSRLETLTHQLAPPELRESALFTHLLEYAWPRFAEHLAKLYQMSPKWAEQCRREYNFQESAAGQARVKVGQRWRKLVGRIDAIDPIPGLVTVTDYKRRNLPTRKETRRGTAPQLGFYALALDQLEERWADEGLLLGYWNIYRGEWQAQAVSSQARDAAFKLGLAEKETPDCGAIKEQLVSIWAWREDDIDREQRYYADPSQCALCSYAGICRKDDPMARESIDKQRKLASYDAEGANDAT